MATSLPPELLLHVLSHVDGLQDRLPLLRVCKSWYRLFQPAVYSTVTIEYIYDLIKLVHAVRCCPRLGASIRTLHYPNYMSESMRSKGEYYDAILLRELVTCVAKDRTHLNKWEERLSLGDEDAWLSLLFLSLENLTSIDMSYEVSPYIFQTVESIVRPHLGHDDDASLEAEKKKKNITALQNLENIRIWTEEMFLNTFCARGFAPFFLLPSMKVFHAVKVHEEPDFTYKRNPEYDSDTEEHTVQKYQRFLYPDSDLKLPPRSSPVREIVLGQSNCRQGFAEYITACAGLERFEYQHTNEAVHQNAYFNFRPRAFYDPLLTQRETLRVLRLNDTGVTKNLEDNEEDADGNTAQEVIESWFGSLAEFTALRELRIPLRNLLDFKNGRALQDLTDVLPGGIEVLCIAKVDRRDYNLVVRELMELLIAGFASLREVIVQLYQLEIFDGEEEVCDEPPNYGVPQFATEAFKEVRESCLKMGVEFSLADDGDRQIVRGEEVLVDTAECDFII